MSSLDTVVVDQATSGPRWRAYLILGALSLVWGTSFILIKKGLSVYPPTQVACLRMAISALAFTPVMILHARRLDWSKLPFLLFVGLTSSAIPAFLFANAQLHISSSMAGILNSLTPLFTLVLGVLFFRTVFSWSKVSGVLLGLGGASLLIIMGSSSGLEGDIGWGFLIVLASLCYGAGTNTIGTYLREMNSIQISAFSFGLTGIPLFLYLFAGTNFTQILQEQPRAWEALGYITILALVGTVTASIIFFKLIQRTSALFGSMVAYMMPMVALLWGLLDGEPIGWPHMGGMALILCGVYLSRR
ncbi:MAG: DMT family transporter [Lewinellaceae bacterium]|nr:DMT family transporter [Lewinellaceae bacterium]